MATAAAQSKFIKRERERENEGEREPKTFICSKIMGYEAVAATKPCQFWIKYNELP